MAARNWDGNAIIYNSEYLNLFSSLGLDLREVYPSFSLPAAFSIEESFEYNGIIYPSGFYSLYIQCNVIKESNASLGAVVPNLPLFYVDKFWALVNIKEGSGDLFTNQLNMSLNYSKASNAFECFGESIFWNGIDSLKTDATIPLDHETAPLKCISYNP